MRVVVDTNVFVSAVLKDSSFPAMALRLVERRGVLLKSQATEYQLFEVLARPYLADLISGHSLGWIKKLLAGAETVRIAERIEACRDPTDDKFLELAVSGRAELIVSGDADLLALHPFRGIPIIAPALFVQAGARAE
jgi:putative PIN family toxin of toxin-antitoxin system